MTDLRDLIARAIFLVDYMSMGSESWETAALDGNDDRNQAFEKADAVLAVLADLPADVIERAALALIDRDGFEPDLLREVSRSEYRSDARAAFTAVFGGERDAAVE